MQVGRRTSRPPPNFVTTKESAESAEQVNDEKNDQDGAESDACAAAVAPAAVAVISATATQDQQQDDNQYKHRQSPFLLYVEILP